MTTSPGAPDIALHDARGSRGFYLTDNVVPQKYGRLITVYGQAVYDYLLSCSRGAELPAPPIYLKRQKIADAYGISLPTVDKGTEKLVEWRLLWVTVRWVQRGAGRERLPHRYILLPVAPEPQALDPAEPPPYPAEEILTPEEYAAQLAAGQGGYKPRLQPLVNDVDKGYQRRLHRSKPIDQNEFDQNRGGAPTPRVYALPPHPAEDQPLPPLQLTEEMIGWARANASLVVGDLLTVETAQFNNAGSVYYDPKKQRLGWQRWILRKQGWLLSDSRLRQGGGVPAPAPGIGTGEQTYYRRAARKGGAA